MWQFLAWFILHAYFTTRICSCGSVEMSGRNGYNDDLILRCHRDSYWLLRTVYWKRNETLVCQTIPFFGPKFYEHGKDLEGHITDVKRRWKYHEITISNSDLTNSNFDYYWSCSDDEEGPYSDSKKFKSGDATPTDITSAVANVFNGNLTLEAFPQDPVEDEKITFSCSSDAKIQEWMVSWLRNMKPVLLTGINSTILGKNNISLSENITVALENVSANTNAQQHNITFLASSSVLEDSTWSCQSEEISGVSNNITITVRDKTTESEVEVTTHTVTVSTTSSRTGPKEVEVTTHTVTVSTTSSRTGPKEAEVTTHAFTVSTTSSKTGPTDTMLSGEDSTVTMYIATAVGVTVGILIVAMIITVLVRRKNRQKNDIVMEENVIYGCGSEDLELSPQAPKQLNTEKAVMEENVLYGSGPEDLELSPQTPSQQNTDKPVMMENSIYESN